MNLGLDTKVNDRDNTHWCHESRAGLERVDRGRIDDDMESKEGRRDKDLYRRAAAVAPELGPIELAVEDHRRSALMRQARAVTPCPSTHPTLPP